MTWLGLILGGLGIADLVRGNSERVWPRRLLAWSAAGAVAGGVLALAGAGRWMTSGTAVVVTLAVVAWDVTSRRSLREDRATWPALTVLGLLVGAALVASPWSPHLGGPLREWYADLPWSVLRGVALEQLLVVVGCGLLLTSTGNVFVRLVLTAAGSKVARSEQQIKGGRVLGPMERLLIFGLGLAGELAAASIIVAAKGLLRFPELQSYRAELRRPARSSLKAQRIDVLTEYFLIGSITSWALALGCLVFV